MEPARSRRTGILQVKEFSTGKGIKPPIEARFLQVKEKRHCPIALGPQSEGFGPDQGSPTREWYLRAALEVT
jgi:hypothetical protein